MPEYTVPKQVGESATVPAARGGDPAANSTHEVTLKESDIHADKRFRCENCGRWERSILRFEFEPCLPDT